MFGDFFSLQENSRKRVIPQRDEMIFTRFIKEKEWFYVKFCKQTPELSLRVEILGIGEFALNMTVQAE